MDIVVKSSARITCPQACDQYAELAIRLIVKKATLKLAFSIHEGGCSNDPEGLSLPLAAIIDETCPGKAQDHHRPCRRLGSGCHGGIDSHLLECAHVAAGDQRARLDDLTA